MSTRPASAPLQARVHALQQTFLRIQRERMADVPVLNPALCVQAVGFEPESTDADPESLALGVLLTPWFMNLIRLPLRPAVLLAPGAHAPRQVGAQQLDFIGAQEAWLGAGPLARYEACSLYSPMFEFADQAAAVATATEVLRLLRSAGPAPNPVPLARQAAPATVDAGPLPARRGFLFGRSAAAARR